MAFTVHADLASFTGLAAGASWSPVTWSSAWPVRQDIAATVPLRLTGAIREVGPGRRLLSEVHLDAVSLSASGNPGRSL